jgi:hypothetical protein
MKNPGELHVLPCERLSGEEIDPAARAHLVARLRGDRSVA